MKVAPKVSISSGDVFVSRLWATKATTISVVRRVATVEGGTIRNDLNSNRKPIIPNKTRKKTI